MSSSRLIVVGLKTIPVKTLANAAPRVKTFGPPPAVMLVFASLCWGVGFTWAKDAGHIINASAGLADEAMLGPALGLAIRFGLAALLWLAIFPSSRRDWSQSTVVRGGMLGIFLAGGVISQHLGLATAPAATIAFLTSLAVVIVPVMIAIALRRLPRPRAILAVAAAVVGIWLLTGAKRTTPSIGEFYGIACAFLFSIELLLLNILVPGDDPMRLTPLMFAITSLIALATAIVSPGHEALHTAALLTPRLAADLSLLTIFTTFMAFGLMTIYQPRIDPTRATLIYLTEPIFAAAYARFAAGASMGNAAVIGAALILLANLAAEQSSDGLVQAAAKSVE